MFVTTRMYEIPYYDPREVSLKAQAELMPHIERLRGLRAYDLVHAEGDRIGFVGVFDTREVAEASDHLVAYWVENRFEGLVLANAAITQAGRLVRSAARRRAKPVVQAYAEHLAASALRGQPTGRAPSARGATRAATPPRHRAASGAAPDRVRRRFRQPCGEVAATDLVRRPPQVVEAQRCPRRPRFADRVPCGATPRRSGACLAAPAGTAARPPVRRVARRSAPPLHPLAGWRCRPA